MNNLRGRLSQAVVDAVTVSTRTRTERTYPARGETRIRMLMECEVKHHNAQEAANEVADACREEFETALKARGM